MSPPQTEFGDGVSFGHHGDVLIWVWEKDGTSARQDWISQRALPVASAAGNIMALNIILPSSNPPDAGGRDASSAFAKALGPSLRWAVTVAPGDSFRLNIVRTVLRLVVMLGGQGGKHTVHSTVAEGIEKLHAHARTQTPTAAEMEALANRLMQFPAAPR